MNKLTIIALCFLFVGCEMPKSTQNKAIGVLQTTFSTMDIYLADEENWRYVVRDDKENVWYVEFGGVNEPKIIAKTLIFKTSEHKSY